VSRRSPRGNAVTDLQGVRGGVYLDDGSRPPKSHRFSLNVRRGALRPGSMFDSVLGYDLFGTIYINGLTDYRTSLGTHYTIVVGYAWGAHMAYILRGSHVIESGIIATAVSEETSARKVVTWGKLGNTVVCAGPFDGAIGIIEFQDDGGFDIRTATGINRAEDGLEQSASDDPGPYLLNPPLADIVAIHQDRVMVVEEGTGVLRFSNIRDIDGWPANNFIYLQGNRTTERTTALASISEGRMLVGQRDRVWAVSGSLLELAEATARPILHGIGIVGPATVQVVGNTVVALSERGPIAFMSGQDIPATTVHQYLGGEGAVCPLFDSGFTPADSVLEKYRPLPSGLFTAVSRYSQRDNAYEVTYEAAIDERDQILRRARLRYDFGEGAWSIEQHPPAVALAAIDDGHDDEQLVRIDEFGLMYFEGVGDFDQHYTWMMKYPEDAAIDGWIEFAPVEFTPERGRVRYVYLTAGCDNLIAVDAHVLGDGMSRDDEATASRGFETRDRGFSTDGATNGYTFATDKLESGRTRTRRIGCPPRAAGQRVRVRVSTPSPSAAGNRFTLLQAQAEVVQKGKGET